MNPVVIDNPGYFLLPDCKIPMFRLKVDRNLHGQIRELIIFFDPSRKVWEKLKSHKSVPLMIRGMAEQIEIEIPFYEYREGNMTLGFQHLHLTKLDQNQIEKIERLLETLSSPQEKTPQ